MNAKERAKIQAAYLDAKKKAATGNGNNSKEYYHGMEDILRWVLVEV